MEDLVSRKQPLLGTDLTQSTTRVALAGKAMLDLNFRDTHVPAREMAKSYSF
jgi:hypothetical protein